jgi:hypothetical protein
MIPGAKHAPTIAVGYVTERGGFYISIEDIPKIRRVDTGELVPDAHIEARRQLTVTDPDDQRVIWRLAAHALGATREISTSARFAWQWTTGIGHRWCLLVGHFHASVIWEGAADVADVAHATAALCAAVWGPA